MSKLGEIVRDQVIDSLVLRAELIIHAVGQRQILPYRSKVADLDPVGLRLAFNKVLKDDWPVHKRQVVIMEFGDPPKVSEEAPDLHGQVVRQRCGDNGRLFNLEAVWR